MAEKETKEPKAPKVPKAAGDAGVVVRVKAAGVASRWRCGRHFTAESTDIPATELTEDEFKRLSEDPSLKVDLVAG